VTFCISQGLAAVGWYA